MRPGENVTITINAQPKSYVSVLAVDLGVYLLDNTYDLSRSDIFEELDEKTYSPIPASGYPGLVSGLITMTNAHYPLGNFLGKLTFQFSFDIIYCNWIFSNFMKI